MDKNSIKKFAVWARTELITRVSQRAIKYEIDENGYGEYDADAVNGRVMSAEEKTQRKALIDRIRKKGYHQVMEEVAYTWFNRFYQECSRRSQIIQNCFSQTICSERIVSFKK